MGNPISGDQSAAGAQVSKFYSRATWVDGHAEEQLQQVAGWPGMKAVAGFPDLHPGRYGPVGAAFLADRIWPQLVGPDIGCGMALFRLDLPRRRLKHGRFMGSCSVVNHIEFLRVAISKR
jgi:release factor H-coupled RctB family protein